MKQQGTGDSHVRRFRVSRPSPGHVPRDDARRGVIDLVAARACEEPRLAVTAASEFPVVQVDQAPEGSLAFAVVTAAQGDLLANANEGTPAVGSRQDDRRNCLSRRLGPHGVDQRLRQVVAICACSVDLGRGHCWTGDGSTSRRACGPHWWYRRHGLTYLDWVSGQLLDVEPEESRLLAPVLGFLGSCQHGRVETRDFQLLATIGALDQLVQNGCGLECDRAPALGAFSRAHGRVLTSWVSVTSIM